MAGLKQKVRKYNKDFEAVIESYRQDPSKFKDEEEDKGVCVCVCACVLMHVHVCVCVF